MVTKKNTLGEEGLIHLRAGPRGVHKQRQHPSTPLVSALDVLQWCSSLPLKFWALRTGGRNNHLVL